MKEEVLCFLRHFIRRKIDFREIAMLLSKFGRDVRVTNSKLRNFLGLAARFDRKVCDDGKPSLSLCSAGCGSTSNLRSKKR